MTRNTLITSADKALWERVRGNIRPTRERNRGRDIDGKTANLIAGYLSGTLTVAEKRALSKRLERHPGHLEALVAARAAARETDVAAPQNLRALARHVYPSAPSGEPNRKGGGMAMLPRPVLGWIAASLIAIALAVGGFFLGQRTGGTFADNSAQTTDQKMTDDLELGGEPGLPGSENGLFDALDLDF